MENREYFQMMQLAEILEKDSKCDLCQSKIQDHTILELYTCLQEISKFHSDFVKNTFEVDGS